MYSVANIASPTTISRRPGPGRTSRTAPKPRTPKPAMVTAYRLTLTTDSVFLGDVRWTSSNGCRASQMPWLFRWLYERVRYSAAEPLTGPRSGLARMGAWGQCLGVMAAISRSGRRSARKGGEGAPPARVGCKTGTRVARRHGYQLAGPSESFYLRDIDGRLLEGELERAQAWVASWRHHSRPQGGPR